MPTPIPECGIREHEDGGFTVIIPNGEDCRMPIDGRVISVSVGYTETFERQSIDIWDWSHLEERGFMPRHSIRDAAGGWWYLIVGGGVILALSALFILRSLIE